MTASFGAERVDAYHRLGYLFPVEAVTPAEAADLRAQLEAVERRTGGPLSGPWRHKAHLLFTFLNDLIRRPRLLNAVAEILGPDILCWNTNVFTKEAADPSLVSWHQDATYFGLSRPLSLTAWVALSPSTPESGCMRVIPASHLAAQLPHVERPHALNMLSRGQEVAVAVDEAAAVDLVLEPGQASFHHIMAIHGSRPNRSADRRIGIAIRYLAASVRQLGGHDYATLVRGVDLEGNFEPEPAPAASLDEDALTAHALVMARHTELIMGGAEGRLK
jgi:ectoine hydroxylase-related dioxygenase (phytanoyl-CoA dioxygenase family)